MVALSWISFLIPPNSYPGRIGLLVTIVLCIINVMTGVKQRSPDGSVLNTLDCWCVICLVWVAIASLEYAILLYLMRFRKARIQSENTKNRQGPSVENNLEPNLFWWFQHANYIDGCSLFVIPALFALTAFVYFMCSLYRMPSCQHDYGY